MSIERGFALLSASDPGVEDEYATSGTGVLLRADTGIMDVLEVALQYCPTLFAVSTLYPHLVHHHVAIFFCT